MAARSPPQGDWSSVIAASAFAEEGARQWWWEKQVSKPAVSKTPHEVVNALEGYNPRGSALPGRTPAEAPPHRPKDPGRRMSH